MYYSISPDRESGDHNHRGNTMQLSDHSYTRLQDRNITEDDINHLIKYGSHWSCSRQEGIHYARLNNLFAVFHGSGYWLVTAYRLEDQ